MLQTAVLADVISFCTRTQSYRPLGFLGTKGEMVCNNEGIKFTDSGNGTVLAPYLPMFTLAKREFALGIIVEFIYRNSLYM